MTIFVGNLPFTVSDLELDECFSQFGDVERATIVCDRGTGASRGFGFIEMSDSAAQAAIAELDGCDWGGRRVSVKVSEDRRARTRAEQPTW